MREKKHKNGRIVKDKDGYEVWEVVGTNTNYHGFGEGDEVAYTLNNKQAHRATEKPQKWGFLFFMYPYPHEQPLTTPRACERVRPFPLCQVLRIVC